MVRRARCAEHDCAFDAAVVASPGARELDEELVALPERARAGHAAPVDRLGTGVDQRVCRRRIAACVQNRGKAGGGEAAIEHAGPGGAEDRFHRIVGECGGAAHVLDLGCRLDQPQGPHQGRGIHQLAEVLELPGHHPVVGRGEAVGVELDADAGARQPHLRQIAFSSRAGQASSALSHTRMSVMEEVSLACATSGRRHRSTGSPPAAGSTTD